MNKFGSRALKRSRFFYPVELDHFLYASLLGCLDSAKYCTQKISTMRTIY